MRTRSVKSKTGVGERVGRTSSCRVFHARTDEFMFPSESNGEPGMTLRQVSYWTGSAFLHFRKLILTAMGRMDWMKAKPEQGRLV